MKRVLFVWLLILSAVWLLASCGGSQPAPAETEKSAEKVEESATKVLLGASPVPTPIPALPTPTPVPMPPTPTLRPSPTSPPPATAAEAEATQEPTSAKFKSLTELVEIPAGSFTMGRDGGSTDEGPAHEVDVPVFYMELFEVTNAQFATFVQETAYVTDAEKGGSTGWRSYVNGKENHPVVKISWNDAKAYCEWAGRRLPTEAEWEKAARGDQGFLYPWGNDWDPKRANVKEAGYRGTTPVGTFADGVSPYGLFDMAGNVWEWTADWYQPYPGNTTPDNFYGEQFKVLRGGGWFDEQDQVLSVNRSSTSPEAANDDIGFRCAGDK